MVILVIVFGIILSFIVMIGAYCCCKVASKEDGYIEELRRNGNIVSLKRILSKRNERNNDINAIYYGVSADGLIDPKQELSGSNILYKKKFYSYLLPVAVVTELILNVHCLPKS